MTLHIEIDVWQGEIAELEVDGIVIPANESLFMTGPISAAVKRAAGEEVERAAVVRGPIPPGEVVVTPGGRLAAPYVIHAVAVGHDLRADPRQLTRAVDAALTVAAHLALRRLAIAPIGTERGVFAAADAAEAILSVLTERAASGRELPESLVLAVGPGELAAFRAAVEGRAAGPVPARRPAGEG